MKDGGRKLRSASWFEAPGEAGLAHRAYLKSEGISQRALSNGPVIGICNSWSEVVNCNLHFRGLAEAVKRGVLQAGGIPLVCPTLPPRRKLIQPTAMLLRNPLAMDLEERIRAHPFHGAVCAAGRAQA